MALCAPDGGVAPPAPPAPVDFRSPGEAPLAPEEVAPAAAEEAAGPALGDPGLSELVLGPVGEEAAVAV